MDFLKKELGPLATATRAIIVYNYQGTSSDHIGDKYFDHYSEVGPFLEVPN